MVAAGILLSRLLGLVRQRVFGHFLGTSDAADAFMAAFRIPNMLQNLFGEGVLSASFIPVYSRLLGEGREEDADRLAGAVAAVLALASAVIVLAGVLAAPLLVDVIVPGFDGAKREQTILLVRILFPGAALLAMSAWCLGVLNSHRKFLLSYSAPVLWNIAIITGLLVYGGRLENYPLAAVAAWASVIGSALQFLVQLPVVLKVTGRLKPAIRSAGDHLRTVIRNFFPVFLGRGVYQVSAFVDTILASFLPAGAVVSLAYAQTIYMLPVSLFGMSVSAAELPDMSRDTARQETLAEALRIRIDRGLRNIAFFVVPSAMAFLALGDFIVGLIYQSGAFTAEDVSYVWAILAGSAVGLLASTMGRLYSSAWYALQDTRTPLRFAVVRVGLTVLLGIILAFPVPAALGLDPKWGAAGLTVAAGVAGWVEFALLRRSLGRQIGSTGVPVRFLLQAWGAALLAAGAAWGVRIVSLPEMARAILALAVFGVVYLGVARLIGMPEAKRLSFMLRRGDRS